jgi:hypothetical protein
MMHTLLGKLRGTATYLIAVLLTFHLVGLAWVFFRCHTFAQAVDYLQGMATLRNGSELGGREVAVTFGEVQAALVLIGILLVLVDFPQAAFDHEHEVVLRWPLWLRTASFVVLGACILFARNPGQVPFIYFQF